MRLLISTFQQLILRWSQLTTQQRALIPFSIFFLLLIVLGNGNPEPDEAFIQTRLHQVTTTETARAQRLETWGANIQESEIRGVWLTNVASSLYFAPWGISRAVNQLANMHFNTLYPVVWNRGKSFYHSKTLKQLTGYEIAPLMALMHPAQDPLEEMLQVGHKNSLRVIPWFEYGFMVPLHSRLAKQHPDWLTVKQNGSPYLHEDTFAAENEPNPNGLLNRLLNPLLNSGAPSKLGWLNPLHPSVQDLVLSLVEEIVAEYDVDGIQFDDHFSLPAAFGYDDYTLALYRAEHQGNDPPTNSDDADWIRWRADKFSQFVGRVHERVKTTCPTCIVSLSPNPAKFAYRFHLQDWRTWLDNDWIDELVVQIYRDEQDKFESELAKNTLQSAMDQIPVSIGILTGTWKRPIPFEQIRAQVTSSRDHHFSGVSFFYWDTLWSYFTPESPQKRRQNFRALLTDEWTDELAHKVANQRAKETL